MSTGISLTEEEANVLRDLDNRLSKVKSVKLHIPSPRKDLPTGYGYTRPSSAFDNYLNNNNNSNNTSNNISSNYLNHPTNTNTSNTYLNNPTKDNTNDPLSSPPSSTRRRSPFTSAITDPHARTHDTHAHGTRAQARSARESDNASNHHQDLLNQLRKERRKVVEMGLHAHDNPDNPLSSHNHHDPSSASHYHPSASSSSSHRHSSTSRHRSSSASHHQSSTPHYAPSSSSSSPPSSPRHHHRSKSSKYFEKYQNEDGNNNNNNKYEHNNNNNNYESKSNHKYEDNNGTDQENERERERERDRERERNIERERERESRIHGESKPPPPDGRNIHGNQNKESSYFQEEELRELNERIKLIEMEFGVDPPCEDHPEKEKQRERSKETEREKEDKSDRVKRDSRPPIYNGYLSSLLAPYPPKLENASSRRMDYLPSDWTEEKSMLLPAPKFEVEELKPPISAKGKKARPPLPPPSDHSGPQQDRPSRKNKDPDSPPNPRSASPLFAKKREVSAFASPQKVRMMSEDYPKPILPPDRNTRASSIRNSLAKKKEAEAPAGERRDKKATKKTTGPRSMDDPRASLYGSFSPPMSRTQAKFSKNKRKTDVDDEKHDFTNTKSGILLLVPCPSRPF